MATQTTRLGNSPSLTNSWDAFREFIRWEVAPYPGRVNTVLRMTLTATLVMLVVVTFRIPNAFLGALFAILLARENLTATWRAARLLVLAFVGASLYTLIGMMLFRGSPVTHFFWVVASMFLVFFVLRTTTNYAAALAFAIPVGVALPVWDRSLPSELQVEGTLWPVLIIAVGAGVTMATETLYRIFDRSDPLVNSVDGLLSTVRQVVENFAARHAPPGPLLDRVVQYQRTGTGRLRLALHRQGAEPARRAQRAALISLAGRLIDLAANLEHAPPNYSDEDATRLRALAASLRVLRTQLRGGVVAVPVDLKLQPPSAFPMLQEMEQTVVLIAEVLESEPLTAGSQSEPEGNWWQTVLVPDAFQNPDYVRFAFAGCLAASICYVLYNVLDWRGIGQTAVLTCIVTALTTVGNSLQAQSFRFAGFVTGGLVMGLSAQVLILPGIDSVFGFALLFAAGTALAAWFATSSPRLSFFGVQMALSFYFVNLTDSRIETDLSIARDKVAGVFLGIVAMGLVFDRFGAKSDAEQLQKLLVRNMRLLAQLVAGPMRSTPMAIAQSNRLRNQINDNFANMGSLTDAVRFEFQFRRRRAGDLAACARIQSIQPWLRSIYLLKLALDSCLQRREKESPLSPAQTQAMEHFLKGYSDQVMHLAAWIAREEDEPAPSSDESLLPVRHAFEGSPDSRDIKDICEKMASSLLMLSNAC
jgi:multidrug resistance protein MdtO